MQYQLQVDRYIPSRSGMNATSFNDENFDKGIYDKDIRVYCYDKDNIFLS